MTGRRITFTFAVSSNYKAINWHSPTMFWTKISNCALFTRQMPLISTTILFRQFIQPPPYNIESHACTKADGNLIMPQLCIIILELAGTMFAKNRQLSFIKNSTKWMNINDPAAGSPTAAVLWLYLFLGNTICKASTNKRKSYIHLRSTHDTT